MIYLMRIKRRRNNGNKRKDKRIRTTNSKNNFIITINVGAEPLSALNNFEGDTNGKYYNDAIIGNKEITASYTKKENY